MATSGSSAEAGAALAGAGRAGGDVAPGTFRVLGNAALPLAELWTRRRGDMIMVGLGVGRGWGGRFVGLGCGGCRTGLQGRWGGGWRCPEQAGSGSAIHANPPPPPSTSSPGDPDTARTHALHPVTTPLPTLPPAGACGGA